MRALSKILFTSLLLSNTNSYSIEITPLLGLRGGGEFIDATNDKKHTLASSQVSGLLVSMPYQYGKTLELYYSHQSSNLKSINITVPANNIDIPLTLDYLHFGGTAPISEGNNFDTFVSGGLGFTYLSPDFSNARSDLRTSFSIGIGLKWPITKRVALRLETRGLATLFNNNSAIFCSGGCDIQVSGNFFFQGEVSAGLAFTF